MVDGKVSGWKEGGEENTERRTAAGLYDIELLEKTRFASVNPVFRRCAATLAVPLV